MSTPVQYIPRPFCVDWMAECLDNDQHFEADTDDIRALLDYIHYLEALRLGFQAVEESVGLVCDDRDYATVSGINARLDALIAALVPK